MKTKKDIEKINTYDDKVNLLNLIKAIIDEIDIVDIKIDKILFLFWKFFNGQTDIVTLEFKNENGAKKFIQSIKNKLRGEK